MKLAQRFLMILGCSVFVATAAMGTGVRAQVLDPVCSTLTNPEEATVCQEDDPQTHGNNSIYGPNGILTNVTNLLALVGGAIAVIMIMVGGLKYVLAGGDSNKVSSAKDTIIYSIVGLLVILLARSIIIFVLERII